MARAEWGVKRACLSCGARFYDLQRESIVCPACGAPFDAAVQSKPRRARAAPAAAKAAAVSVAAEPEVEAGAVEDDAQPDAEPAEEEEEAAESKTADDEEGDEDGESAIEDVSELGDDDMTDVIDTEMDEEETDR